MNRAHLFATLFAFGSLSSGAFAEPGHKGKGEDKKSEKKEEKKEGMQDAKAKMGAMAHADLKGTDGKSVGTATLEDTPHGVLVTVDLTNVPAGMHAFHIHEMGKCDPTPGAKGPFTSAGGHFNPMGHKHGVKNPEGMHAGDMPNVDVPADGKLKFQFIADGVSMKSGEKNSLGKDGGTALVLHKGHDDYASDPAGAAGDRMACGVIEMMAPGK